MGQAAMSRREWLVVKDEGLEWHGPPWNTLPEADQEWVHSMLISHGIFGNMLYLLIKGGLTPGTEVHRARVAFKPAPIRMIF